MALDQERYLLSVEASWRRGSSRKKARMSFTGTGVDDRDDHLRWFKVDDVRIGSSIEVVVVDTAVADPPARAPRVTVEKLKRAQARGRLRDGSIAGVKARLHALRTGEPIPVVQPPERPSAVGFSVAINGRLVRRVGVGNPGLLTVTVLGRRTPDGFGARFYVHGGDAAVDGYLFRRWDNADLRLEVGDRVSITCIAPTNLDRGRINAANESMPATAAELQAFLRHLRRSDRATRAALARFAAYERKRPAPRSYPRRPRQ